ncbi:pilus assembly protein PilN [Hahella sp. CCB-MM4]|uniref:PilN domain-containing protein n=1 Tax=Hahella sp. (strain CCB-MM4) TaxID=1926491 RepID=UPI000B9C3782|nr:PilN domain-containing protein [Hahella sp. CCB-MM4]OZG71435.1 pilus assembly protein PilN [Hahella sp. CCB-MM4]
MAKINLRPWREELRAERQKQFITVLAGFLIISAGLGFLWHQTVVNNIDYQEQRNNFIKNEIAQLNKQIKEIQQLKKRRDELLERMRVIQDLQGKRPIIVRQFDELVRVMPDGVYLTSLSKSADSLALQGVGESNSRISNLMRNLDESDWYKEPNLSSVKALSGDETKSAFVMSVKQETPGSEDKKKGGA